MTAKFRKFFIQTLPPSQQERFDQEIARRNLRAVYLVLPLILLFEAFNLVRVLFFTRLGLASSGNRLYFCMYISLFIVTLAALIASLILRRRVERHARAAIYACFVYSWFICLWSALLTAVDLRFSDNISVYAVTAVSISILVYLRPWQFLLLFASSHALLLLGVPLLGVPKSYTGAVINATVLFFTSLCMALYRQYSKGEDYLNKITITQQAEEIRQINARLQKLVLTDALSGLYNRRFLEEKIRPEWDTRMRAHPQTAVLMLDIDDFKRYNDMCGHQAGDACLIRIAEVIHRHATLPNDYLIRYGGEEFMLVSFGVAREEILHRAEEIRAQVEALSLESHDGPRHITVSIGICLCDGHETPSLSQCLHQADQALYQAKSAGKNTVVLYTAAGKEKEERETGISQPPVTAGKDR